MKIPVFLILVVSVIGNPFARRAGAPEAVPLPSSCTTYNPLLALEPTNYAPAPSFLNESTIYAFYLYHDSPAVTGAYTKCIQQCHGFGNDTCKAIFYASAVPRPPMFGSPGGYLTTACLMFDRFVEADDFVIAESGTYDSPVVACLSC